MRRLLWRRREVFEMHVLPESDLGERLARHPRLHLLAAVDDGAAGAGWRGRRWSVVNRDDPPQLTECEGYVLYAYPGDLHIGAPIIAGLAHEPHVAAVFRERLRAGDVVLDVGANIGSLAMLAASLVGPQGRVFAVEPIARNGQQIGYSAHAMASVRSKSSRLPRAIRQARSNCAPIRKTSNSATVAASGERLRDERRLRLVPAVLDSLFADLDRTDLVKIDIEGMEPAALRGLERTIARLRPILLSEFNPWAIERATATDAIDYLRWLRRWYPAITILHRDGRERCR
jgi:FkbM family methyltransferase